MNDAKKLKKKIWVLVNNPDKYIGAHIVELFNKQDIRGNTDQAVWLLLFFAIC